MDKRVDFKQIAKTLLDSLGNKQSQQDQLVTIKQFVGFLAKNNLLSQSGKLVETIREEMVVRSGKTAVRLEDFGDLNEQDIEKIKSVAATLLGENIDITEDRNKQLLGGIKLRVANKVIDATIKRKLQNLSRELNKNS